MRVVPTAARRAAGWFRENRPARIVTVAVALALIAGTGGVAIARSQHRTAPTALMAVAPGRQPDPLMIESAITEAPTTTAPVTTTTTAKPAAPATTTAQPAEASGAPSSAGDGSIYGSLGTWVDAFDFDPAHTNDNPSVTPASVDRMAAAGVHTLYLQAARPEDDKAPGDLMSPSLLSAFVKRAHANGMQVVGWYLPHFADVADDMRHLQAMLDFSAGGQGFDSISLDIEWRASVADPAQRSALLVDLAQRLHKAAGDLPVSATVLPPVVTDVLNTNYWPNFPWHQIAPLFSTWLPMDYWTNRDDASPYRDAHTYTADNISMLRKNLGQPDAQVHVIGGIADKASLDDYRGFVAAANEGNAIGVSVYDWATTSSAAWPILRQ